MYASETFPEPTYFIKKTKGQGPILLCSLMTGMGKEVEDLASPKQYIMGKLGKGAFAKVLY